MAPLVFKTSDPVSEASNPQDVTDAAPSARSARRSADSENTPASDAPQAPDVTALAASIKSLTPADRAALRVLLEGPQADAVPPWSDDVE